jgi:hypothetical protein
MIFIVFLPLFFGLLSTYVAEVPFYLADDEVALEAAFQMSVTRNVAKLMHFLSLDRILFFMRSAEKDERQCLGTLGGRDRCSIIISKPLSSQALALYPAEICH